MPNENNETQSRISDLERELQILRLELEEKERRLHSAEHDLSVHASNAKFQIISSIQAQLKQLFTEVGGPVVQIITQHHLSSIEGKTLNAKDVLAVSNRLVACLKNHGLATIGVMGETLDFDPSLHETMSMEDEIKKGDQVIVRMVGLSFDGQTLRRIMVSRLVP